LRRASCRAASPGSYPVTHLEHVLEPDQLIAHLLFGLLAEQTVALAEQIFDRFA